MSLCRYAEWAFLRHSSWLRPLLHSQALPHRFQRKWVRALWILYINIKVYYIRHFAHFRKASIRFVMDVCQSGRPRRRTRLPLDGFKGNGIWELYKNVEKLHVWLNSGIVMGILHKDKRIYMSALRRILLRPKVPISFF